VCIHLCGGVRVVCMCGSVCVPLVCMCGSVLYMCMGLNGCILMWTYSMPPLQAQLQLAVEQADMFHQSYQSLDAGLGSVEETQEKEESIHSEVEVVKQQLESHKVRVTASSSNCSAPVPYPLSVPGFTPPYQ